MYITKEIITSTHLDKDGDKFTKTMLESLVKQINGSYIPAIIEHDPRNPPIGRLKSAELLKLKDGEFAVQTVTEVFEKEDLLKEVDYTKAISLTCHKLNEINVVYDKTFVDDDLNKIKEIGSILKSEPCFTFKKSIDPITVLEITGGLMLGSFVKGFFSKIGADVYDKLKKLISQILNKNDSKNDQLLNFVFTVYGIEPQINIKVILNKPTEKAIDDFLTSGLKTLEEILPQFNNEEYSVREIVFEYYDNKIILLFGVRSDAVPIYPQTEDL